MFLLNLAWNLSYLLVLDTPLKVTYTSGTKICMMEGWIGGGGGVGGGGGGGSLDGHLGLIFFKVYSFRGSLFRAITKGVSVKGKDIICTCNQQPTWHKL